MNNKLSFAIAAILLVKISTGASAYVVGGSNLDLLGYPKHKCWKPTRPYDLTDGAAVDSYNFDLDTYIECINSYVENAKNDIERITEAANAAIQEANAN